MSDPCRMDDFRMDYFRMGVINPVFEGWKAQGRTEEVTRIRRTVSPSGDLYTQHPNISETEITIDAWVKLGPAGREDMDLGAMGSLDGVVKTADGLEMGDLILYHGEYFEVDRPPIEVCEGESFLYRKCGLKRVELRGL